MAKTPSKQLAAKVTRFGQRQTHSDLAEAIDLSPSQIRSWLLQAEEGDITAAFNLWEEMEKRDGLLGSHLRTRKMGVLSLPWEIVPPRGMEDDSQAQEMAQYCREIIDDIGSDPPPGQPLKGIRAGMFDVLDAIGKGFSAVEIDWETDSDEWRPVWLHYRPQRWFSVADDGKTLRLRGKRFGQDEQLNPLNWILHASQAQSGFVKDWPLLRACVRPFVMRHYSIKDWLSFAEIYGIPPRVGRLPEGSSWDDPVRKDMERALSSMGVDMSAVLPHGADIEFPELSGGREGEIFQQIGEKAKDDLTLSILGQLATSSEGGGWSKDGAQEAVRKDLLESDAQDLDETMTQMLLRPIVRLNHGEDAPVPRWHTVIKEAEDLESLSSVIGNLVEAGAEIPAKYVYEKFEIPAPEDGEDVLRPAGQGMLNADISDGDSPSGGGRGAQRRDEGAGSYGRGEMDSTRADINGGYDLVENAYFRAEARRRHVDPEHLLRILNAEPVGETEDVWRMEDEDAIAWAEEKRVADEQAWDALSPAGRQRVWWVSGLGQQPTALVANEMIGVLREGRSENEFLSRIEDLGLSVPDAEEPGPGQIASWQARIVHRNNRWAAHNAAQYQRLQRDRDVRPYGEWVCHSPCPICQPLCGNIAPLNGQFFATYWPQVHHQCQCEVVSVSERQVRRDEGLQEMLQRQDPQPNDADPGFLYNPGDAFYVEGRGQEPATETGQADREILGALSGVSAFLGGQQ